MGQFSDLDIYLGQSPGVYTVNKFGENRDVDTGTDPEDVWTAGGLYSYPSAAEIIQVSSSSTEDDGDPGGTGAKTLTIQGVDGNFDLLSETVTMDGSAVVETTSSFRRVFRAFCVSYGSNESNVGTITANYKVSATTAAKIEPDEGQTLMALYTVPNGHTALMYDIYGTIRRNAANPAGAHCKLKLYERGNPDDSDSGWRIKYTVGLSVDGSSNIEHKFVVPRKIVGPCDIRLTVTDVSDNDTDVSAGFDLVVFNNNIIDDI